MPRLVAVLVVLSALAALSAGCHSSGSDRAAVLAAADTLVVGAPWPWARQTEMLYREGVDLAVAEINAAGGVLGRPVRVRYVDDDAAVDRARLVAQELVADPAVAAVVGHLHSYTTLPAAAIYERGGLLLLAPSATDPALTARGYRRVFRTTPSSDAIGAHVADAVAQQGHRRVLLCYVDSDYGRALANAVERRGTEQGLEVVLRQSYSADLGAGPAQFRQMVAGWRSYVYDAVVLAGEVPQAALLVAQARAAGVSVPIYGSDAMAVPALVHVGGAAVEGVRVPTRFLPEDASPSGRRFVEQFRARFGVVPDLGAAAAYDALHLWAAAVTHAGTAVPDSVATALRTMPPRTGVTGPLAFTDRGDLATTPLQTAVVRSGTFHLREAVR
jgi:branched-chain amino acid transport system substrate-binding protein